MTLYPPDYARPPPNLRPRWDRVEAIWQQAVRERATALNIVLLTLIYLVVILPLALVFSFGALLVGPNPNALRLFDFPLAIAAWPFFLVLLASSVGAAVIARDVATRTLTLYFSRPIERSDYLVAKATAVGFWMLLGTVLPGVIGVVLLLSLGDISLALAVQGGLGYVAIGLLATIFLTALALLVSSVTSRPIVAGAGIFGALIGAQVVALAIGGVSGQANFDYVSPISNVLVVAQAVFGVSTGALNAGISAALLLGEAVGALLVVQVRLARAGVVGE